MVMAAGSVIKEPSSGPRVRMVNHHAFRVPPNPLAILFQHDRLGEFQNGAGGGQDHDHHDKDRLGEIDLVADVIDGGLPVVEKDDGDHEGSRPTRRK